MIFQFGSGRNSMIQKTGFKKTTQILILVVMFIFITKFFESTPFETLFFQLQAGFLGVILLFLLFYISSNIVKKKPFNRTVLYFLLLIVFMPLYSAFRSHVEFGQPYFYGLASQRGWLLLGVGVWFYYMLATKKIAMPTVESSFLLLAWGSLILFSIFVLTFDPSQLTGEENLVHMTTDRGLRFKFQTFFITFGSLYYFIKYSEKKRLLDLLILLAFLTYVVFVIQGRTYMIFLAMIFLLYYYNNYSLSKFMMNIIKTIVLLFVVILLIQAIIPEYLENMGDLFWQMFSVLAGEKSNDSSANARIWESLIVTNYFDEHPLSIWFGTGRVSHQWNEGYESIFGYFYPEDIGVLGGLFLYGVFGMVLLLIIPLILELKEIKKAKVTKDIFIVAIKYMLILSILHSVQGGLYFGASVWIVLFFILYAYNQLNRRQNAH